MANSVWLLPVVTGIISFLIFIGVTAIVIYFSREIKNLDVEPNAPIIDMSLRKQFTNGHSLGLIKTIRPNQNGTFLIEAYPLDTRQGIGKKLPELQRFVLNKELLISLARGDLSSHREIMKISARSKHELPDKMRKDLESDYLSMKGQLAFIKELSGDQILNGDEAMHQMNEYFSRGQVSKDSMAQMREEIAQYRKVIREKPQEEKTEEKK